MSRYDGLIIPRSYSEYINKTDAATLQQALQQSGVMDAVPTAGSNHPVKSGGVKTELEKYIQFRTINVTGAGATYEIPVDPNDISKNLIIQGWIMGIGQVLDIISYYDPVSAYTYHITKIESLSYETKTAGILKITNNNDATWKEFRGKVILIF